jgi:TPR repeat protein
MLKFISNLINLNVVVAGKARALIAYNEAEAFCRAKDFKQALPLMIEASDLGDEHATVQAAMMFLKGQGAACDWHRAAEYLALAITRGVPDVHLILGIVFGIGGYGLKRNQAKAEFHLAQAASVDADSDAVQMLTMLRKKQGVFSGKERPNPAIPWK